ncbi:MAG: hypothetical protein A2X29_00680 [Elusimicrobia bacterium GWA2_64_40]|nr:MAG: hypothetical protein A2X29_00680 [Elusimicrobia bacterium GWA2_64_40]
MKNFFLPLFLAAALMPSAAAAEGRFGDAVAALRRQPAGTPEQAVINVLKYMRHSLVLDPDVPFQREPHAWTGREVIEAGTVNGCVEAAKAFFDLSRAAYPKFRLVYLDSFNSARPDGGHAVVEAAASDGRAYIVDTSAFPRMPGAFRLTDKDLSRPVPFNPKYTGKVLQFNKSVDVFATHEGGRYLLYVYPYGTVFGPLKEKREFGTLKEMNRALGKYPAAVVDAAYLRDKGIALQYLDTGRSAFLFAGARHVVYTCYTRLPYPDNALEVEAVAREAYAGTGAAGTCNRAALRRP